MNFVTVRSAAGVHQRARIVPARRPDWMSASPAEGTAGLAALGEQPQVLGVEPVDVLPDGDRVDDRLAVDLLRHRQLHDQAVGAVIVVDLVDPLQKLGLGGLLRVRQAPGDGR